MVPRPGRPLSVFSPRVTIGFVYCLPRFTGLLPALLAAGCSHRPATVVVPPYFLNVANPNAAAYIVKDVGGKTEGGGFRWAFAHPVLRFIVPPMDHPKFVMDFALPEPTFRVTGPVTLTFSLNGRLLDKQRFAEMGQHHYEHEVADGFLRFGAVNLVSIDPDKVFVADDGAKLSFPFSRVGFVE